MTSQVVDDLLAVADQGAILWLPQQQRETRMTFTTDRRTMFKTAGLGLIALSAPQIMVRAATAQVPAPSVPNPGFSRFKMGSFEITTLRDGLRPGDGPHPTFGANQPAEEVAKLLEANFLPADKFVNGFAPTLINTGADLILFDTGIGEGGREGGLGQTRAQLEASGYKPEDVTIVVITHFHGDHIGGLTEGGQPAFPNARYVTGQAEYDFWTAPERMSGPTEGAAKTVEAKIKPLADKMTFIGDGGTVVSGITGMDAAGHTPGHMIYMVESGGKQLVLTADTANHYVASLQRPDWHVAFDADKDKAAATRQKVLGMIATDRLPFIGYHMPYPSLGYLEKIDGGYRWVAASYQMML
jgi:glyoxylase-like metal-dependent hydrolase (beta-lactamase superfamily II)